MGMVEKEQNKFNEKHIVLAEFYPEDEAKNLTMCGSAAVNLLEKEFGIIQGVSGVIKIERKGIKVEKLARNGRTGRRNI